MFVTYFPSFLVHFVDMELMESFLDIQMIKHWSLLQMTQLKCLHVFLEKIEKKKLKILFEKNWSILDFCALIRPE